MKRISFFLALVLIVASFGMAGASSVTLDASTGTYVNLAGDTLIIPGVPVTFDMRFTSTLTAKASFTNGFRIYGPSSYDPIVGDTLIAGFTGNFDFGLFINYAGNNGSGADTVGLGGVVNSQPGLPAGFDAVPFRITTGNIPEGETLCLDSSFYPTTGEWLWDAGVGGTENPEWGGPYCFLSLTPDCLPPTYSGPLTLTGSHCDVMTHDFGAEFALNSINIPLGALEFSANIGSITAAGVWSYAPTLADVGASVTVIITAGNGTCSGDFPVNLTFTNEAPVITCPPATDISTGMATEFTITATDDCDVISFSVGAMTNATATIADPNTGVVMVTPVGEGAYSVEIIADDGNASSSCAITGNAIAGSLFQVEIECVGDQSGNFVFQGQHVSVPVNLNGKVIGGYDLLIAYDNSALSFQSAAPGADLTAEGWEYFTYRFGADGNCGNACPSGLLRLVAIAETSNGPNHPSAGGVSELAVLDFLVTNDRTFQCQEIPIRFFWMDCGDNALSNWTGDELHISEVVFDGDEVLFPPNGNEIQDSLYGYPTYFGAQDVDCFTDPVKMPIRDVSFNNGCVFIACADSIDARGDINLNSVPNEIADAVLYSNYFIYGIGYFTINTEGQIAASDVNADGLSLSVADLVYLIRIVVGDALPYAKLAPVTATIVDNNGSLNVDAEMGAALVVIEGNVSADLLADNMEIQSHFDGVNTRVLVYSLEGNSFSGDFLNANGTIVSVELGSAEGAQVNARLLPANFGLAQNYPNPFNPSTIIEFSVPFNSDVTLTIYNVTGQKVAEFSGAYEAGIQTITYDASAMASGVYFYKLNAGDFSQTKKMVLLK